MLLYELSWGASLRSAAAKAGCHHSTVSRLIQQDEFFAERIARAQEHLLVKSVRRLHYAGQSDWRAAARLLEYLERRAARTQERQES